jgi:hypothetical protein
VSIVQGISPSVDHCATGNTPSSKLSKYNAPGGPSVSFDATVGTRDVSFTFAIVGTNDVVTFEATVGTVVAVLLEDIVGTNDVTFETAGGTEVAFSLAIVGVRLAITGGIVGSRPPTGGSVDTPPLAGGSEGLYEG